MLGMGDNQAVIQIHGKTRAKTIGMAWVYAHLLATLRRYDIVLEARWITTDTNHLADKCTRAWELHPGQRQELLNNFRNPRAEWVPHRDWGRVLGTPTNNPIVNGFAYRREDH